MPVIVKAKGRDSTNDVIKAFKKKVGIADIVQKAKDRRYNVKPALKRAVKKQEIRRKRKRHLSVKKMKNVPTRMVSRQPEA